MTPVIVSGVEAAQELLQVAVRIDEHAEHFAADPAVEALHHVVGLRHVGPGMPVLGPEGDAGPGECRCETNAIVGQHVGEAEGKRRCGFPEKGDGALLGFVVLDGQVDGA